MKKLAYIGTGLGALLLLGGLYVHFVLAPARESALDAVFSSIFDENRVDQTELWNTIDLATNMSIALLFAGIVGVVLSIIPAIKKHGIAWLGVLFSLIATFFGLLHGTHMFS